MTRLIGLAVALILFLATIAGHRLHSIWMQHLVLSDNQAVISVSPGDSLRTVLAGAENKDWIEHARWLGWLASVMDLDQSIKAGEYQLDKGTTAAEMIQVMAEGKVVQYSITLPEGITFREALNLIRAHPKIVRTPNNFLERALSDLTGQKDTFEGLFLPETWSFSAGDSDLTILRRAHHALIELLQPMWKASGGESVLSSAYAALTLASIVERETGVASERPLIAGVFLKRLSEGMRLQTDPTVIYGLGEEYDGDLKRSHLRDINNPYNTYVIKGLPPSPIALPGEASIRAVFAPAETDALYFVAKGDGSHAFSATLSEHKANVRRFQLERRADYRSSPASAPADSE